MGKHIHTGSGNWIETSSGVGSNADSYYEYLLKSYLMFNKYEYLEMFIDTFHPIKRFVQYDDWFGEVDMNSGKNRRNRVESLQAFWPGMEASIGLTHSSSKLLNAFYGIWNSLDFIPEEFDQLVWLSGNGVHGNTHYPLRPELIESTYHHYMSTKDRSWLKAGLNFLESIETYSYTECGYASISDSKEKTLSDDMPSYFLSETCKYLYLLFDETNFLHDRAYIFSTEAHPFDILQLPPLQPLPPNTGSAAPSSENDNTASATTATTSTTTNTNNMDTYDDNHYDGKIPVSTNDNFSSSDQQQIYESSNYIYLRELIETANNKLNTITYTKQPAVLSLQCPTTLYWDSDVMYDAKYLTLKMQHAILAASTTTAATAPTATATATNVVSKGSVINNKVVSPSGSSAAKVVSSPPPQIPSPSLDSKSLSIIPTPTTTTATTTANAIKRNIDTTSTALATSLNLINTLKYGILNTFAGHPVTTILPPIVSVFSPNKQVENDYCSEENQDIIISRLMTMTKIINWDSTDFADLNSDVYTDAKLLYDSSSASSDSSYIGSIDSGSKDNSNSISIDNDDADASLSNTQYKQQEINHIISEIQHELFFNYISQPTYVYSSISPSIPQKSTRKCYIQDKTLVQEEALTQVTENAPQVPKLELNAGALGMYTITSLNDGFRIESHLFNDVVEVSNG